MEPRKDLSADMGTRHMGLHRRGWIHGTVHLDSVVCHSIALQPVQDGRASPFPFHGHTQGPGSRLFDPDW
jgi:hypothetical protein